MKGLMIESFLMRSRSWRVFVLLCLAVSSHAGKFPDEQWKKLDTFEAHTLAKADQVFNQQQYRAAAAAYDSFILEFPRSAAVPYALLQKGYSLQLDEKRFQAIEVYNDILDYFPTQLDFAGEALYRIGESQWANGNIEKAMVAWAEMADDPDYSKHVLAGRAMKALADNLMKQDKVAEAVGYYEKAGAHACRSDRQVTRWVLPTVVRYHFRTAPNEPRFRAFYTSIGGFEENWSDLPEDIADTQRYWQWVWGYVLSEGTFTDIQKDVRKKYYEYWAGVFATRFPEWDDYRILASRFRFMADGNKAQHWARLDEQFRKYDKPGDWQRLSKWLGAYRDEKEKLDLYLARIDYGKLDLPALADILQALCTDPNAPGMAAGTEVFDKFYTTVDFATFTTDEIWTLVAALYDRVRRYEMARNILLHKQRYAEMTDDQIIGIARWLWHRDDSVIADVCMQTSDKDRGKADLMEYYYWRRNATLGLPLAEELLKVDAYATSAWWKKAEFLAWSKQYEKAIQAYRTADNPPTTLWRIVDCHVGLGKSEPALAQLREIENFFKTDASAAALRIAHIYRDTSQRERYIAGLRSVLKKYPDSKESSQAHQELEALGIRIGGGIDAE